MKALKAENKGLKAENARLAAKLEEAELKARNDAETIGGLCGLCFEREKEIARLKRYIESGVCV